MISRMTWAMSAGTKAILWKHTMHLILSSLVTTLWVVVSKP